MTKAQKELYHSRTCLLSWLVVSVLYFYYMCTLDYKVYQHIACIIIYLVLVAWLIPATSYYTWQLDKPQESVTTEGQE